MFVVVMVIVVIGTEADHARVNIFSAFFPLFVFLFVFTDFATRGSCRREYVTPTSLYTQQKSALVRHLVSWVTQVLAEYSAKRLNYS